MGKKGKLLFKGDNKRPKKKSKKAKTDREDSTGKDSGSTQDVVASAPTTTTHRTMTAATAATPTIQTGTGTITTSGTVVTGHDTKFEKEISIGDAILVTIHGNNNHASSSPPTEEMRVVTMRLSNASLNLSSAFSENLRDPQSFRYVRKPRNVAQERKKERQAQLEEAGAVERNAFDIYGSASASGGGDNNNITTEVFTYREKTETGSYRVKQQHVSSSSSSQLATRGGMLNLRSKKTSDKYC